MSPPPVLFKTMSFESAPAPPRPVTDEEAVVRRVIAGIVDVAAGLVLLVIAAATVGTLDVSHGFVAEVDGVPALAWMATIVLSSFLSEALTGRTLGKAVTGLRVVRAEGGPAGWRAIAVRTLLRLVDGLPVFYALGVLVILVTPTHQRIGDLAARTVVVRDRG